MDQTNILLAMLTLTVSAVLVYSNVRHVPHQTAVRYMAVWMLVILLLALGYRAFGPFSVNTTYQQNVSATQTETAATHDAVSNDKAAKDGPADKGMSDGYTPPNE